MAVKACILGGAISEHQGEQKTSKEICRQTHFYTMDGQAVFLLFPQLSTAAAQLLNSALHLPARYLTTPYKYLQSVLFRANAPAQKRRHNKKFGRPEV